MATMTSITKTTTLTAVLLSCASLTVTSTLAQERGPAGTVTLTRTDYDRLLDLASRQPRPPDGAPLAAALTRADIRARVAAGIVRATMTVDGEVFQTGTVKVPLIKDATLLDARTGRSSAGPRCRGQRTCRTRRRSSDVRRHTRMGIVGHDQSRPGIVRPAGTASRERDGDLRRSRRAIGPSRLAGSRAPADVCRWPHPHRGDARSGIADAGLVVFERDRTGGRAT